MGLCGHVLQVTESPELYRRVVQPYIAAIPPKRTQWVRNILSKQVGYVNLPS
jgi:m7GpppX diphosphatase